MKNADVPWGSFDPIAYVEHNYRAVQAEDAEILDIVGAHFADHFRACGTGTTSCCCTTTATAAPG